MDHTIAPVPPATRQSANEEIGRKSADQSDVEAIITCAADVGMAGSVDQSEEGEPDCHDHEDSAIYLSDDGRSGRASSNSPPSRDPSRVPVLEIRDGSPRFNCELAPPSFGNRIEDAEPRRETLITELDDDLFVSLSINSIA